MLRNFFKLFSNPVFEDPEKAIQAKILHRILVSVFGLTFLFLIYAIAFPPPGQIVVAVIALIFELVLLNMLREGRIALASTIFSALLWAAVTVSVVLYGGIRDTGFLAYIAILVIAGFTQGGRTALAYAFLTLLAAIILAVLETGGLLPPYQQVAISSVVASHAITVIAVALILDMTVRNITSIAKKAIASEAEQRQVNQRLEQAQQELAAQSLSLEKQNKTLRVIAELSKFTGQAETEQEILTAAMRLTAEHLDLGLMNFYIAGATKQAAYLLASNSAEGQARIDARHFVEIVESDTPYKLTASNTIRCQIGAKYYFIAPPPLFSDSRNSHSLPMVWGTEFLGILNIQNTSDPEYPDLGHYLQPIIDQLSALIANTRNLREMREQVKALSRKTGNTTDDSWERIDRFGTLGFQYDQVGVLPANEELPEEVAAAISQGKVHTYQTRGDTPRSRLIAPILSRGEVIGIIGYEQDREYAWQEEERILLETIASRVSLALENTRLVAEAQKRAERERMISQTASRMRETLDIDTVLQTAVREIRRSLSVEQAEIRLTSLDDGQNISRTGT